MLQVPAAGAAIDTTAELLLESEGTYWIAPEVGGLAVFTVVWWPSGSVSTSVTPPPCSGTVHSAPTRTELVPVETWNVGSPKRLSDNLSMTLIVPLKKTWRPTVPNFPTLPVTST